MMIASMRRAFLRLRHFAHNGDQMHQISTEFTIATKVWVGQVQIFQTLIISGLGLIMITCLRLNTTLNSILNNIVNQLMRVSTVSKKNKIPKKWTVISMMKKMLLPKLTQEREALFKN